MEENNSPLIEKMENGKSEFVSQIEPQNSKNVKYNNSIVRSFCERAFSDKSSLVRFSVDYVEKVFEKHLKKYDPVGYGELVSWLEEEIKTDQKISLEVISKFFLAFCIGLRSMVNLKKYEL